MPIEKPAVTHAGRHRGLRCGEIIALEQTDIDLERNLLHVRRSEWEGHVTLPKGGRARQVNMTTRLTDALRANRHFRGDRVLYRLDEDPKLKVTQVLLAKWMCRVQRRAGLKVRKFLKVQQVATLLSVSRATVYRLVDEGQIERVWVGTSIRVPERSVDAYLEASGADVELLLDVAKPGLHHE